MGTINRFCLEEIPLKHSLSTFIETGTYKCDGLRSAMRSGFGELHSIEIDPEFYFSAAREFSTQPHVFIHLGDSHIVLPQILQHSLTEYPALFWLDAHFPFADSGKVSYGHESNNLKRMPILQELDAIINSRSNISDIIIIDDLRCFTDDDRIPANSFDVHMASLGARGLGCTRETVVGVTLMDILNLTNKFYNHHLVFQDEGYIILSKN